MDSSSEDETVETYHTLQSALAIYRKYGRGAYDDWDPGLVALECLSRSTGFTAYRLPPFSLNKLREMVRALEQDDIRRHPYLRWSKKELATCVTNRKIIHEGPRTKVAFMFALEKADEERVFPLLELPVELRVMVYKHALARDIELHRRGHVAKESPAILRTCKLVRNEAKAGVKELKAP